MPGTGVALSFFCWAKPLAYFFIFCLYPLLALAGAFNVARHELRVTRSVRRAYTALCAAYKEHLLAPEDWCVDSEREREREETKSHAQKLQKPSPNLYLVPSRPASPLAHFPARFTFWRLNSRIAAYHELLTHSPGYTQEDKWTFLVDGDRLGVPVTPVIKVRGQVGGCMWVGKWAERG